MKTGQQREGRRTR
jgi:hypothetical protein